MGFGIFKKIKNGNKAVAGRLKKKAMIESGTVSNTPSWKFGETVPKPKLKAKIKTRDDYPGLRFK